MADSEKLFNDIFEEEADASNEVDVTDTAVVSVEKTGSVSGSPLDLPTEVFEQSLERREANRSVLIKWIRGSLVEDVDYGSIMIGGRKSRPSLFKPGAQKIVGKLGMVATFPNLTKYEDAVIGGNPINDIILKCELINPNGEPVATGVGARSVDKDGGDLNKALKMAKKSALIDATLDVGGLSEVFTQDIEDMNLADKKPAQSYDATQDPEAKYPAPPQEQESKPVSSTEWSIESREGAIRFGKHKGVRWSEVEDSYLEWLYGATQSPDSKFDPWMNPFIFAEINHRKGEGEHNDRGRTEDEPKAQNSTKEYPADYSDDELIKLITVKLKDKYIEKFSADEWDMHITQKLGSGGLKQHQRESLLKFIDSTADQL